MQKLDFSIYNIYCRLSEYLAGNNKEVGKHETGLGETYGVLHCTDTYAKPVVFYVEFITDT